MLEMSGVSLRRGSRVLLEGFSLQLPDPGIYVFCGACASGKTLLSKMLAGRLAPDRGTVSLDGTPLYRPRGGGVGSLLRPPPQTGPLFYAATGQALDEAEPLYHYLDVELWRAGAPSSALLPYWEVLEKHIAGARQRTLGTLASSELALAQLALGAAIPVRVVALDGQLGSLDAQCLPLAQKLLALAPPDDRFIVLTAPTGCVELGRETRVELAGGVPVSVVAAEAAD